MLSAVVVSNTTIAQDTQEVVLQPNFPFVYLPGQYITLMIPKIDGSLEGRSYSVASLSGDKTITLMVRIVSAGLGSTYIQQLQPGDSIQFVGPSGKFKLATPLKNSLFIATGTGSAPFVPMIDTLLATSSVSVTLLLGFRQEEDSFFTHMVAPWKTTSSHFQAIEILSRPRASWIGEKGRVTDYLAQYPDIVRDKHLYVCGNGDMVKEVVAFAQQQGLPHEDIFYEKY